MLQTHSQTSNIHEPALKTCRITYYVILNALTVGDSTPKDDVIT